MNKVWVPLCDYEPAISGWFAVKVCYDVNEGILTDIAWCNVYEDVVVWEWPHSSEIICCKGPYSTKEEAQKEAEKDDEI